MRTDRLPRPLERNEQARAPQWVEKSRGLCAHAPPRTSPVFDPFGPRGAAEEKGGADAAPRRATAATGSAGAASSGGGAARAGALRESPPPPRPAAEEEFWACGGAFTDDDDGATATSVATSDDAFASDFWACTVIEEAEHEAALNELEFEIFLCAPSDGDFAHPPFP